MPRLIALDSKKLKVPRHQRLYTTHVEKVILVSTTPSNLALDAPVNEEKMKFNLIETEQVILVSKLVMHGYSWLCMVIVGYAWL